jgi:hypothetical protein
MVSITNDRGESDRNIQLTVELPEGFRVESVRSPGVQYDQVGNRIRFQPIAELRAKEPTRFYIEFTPNRAGRFNFKATVESVLTREPIEQQHGIDVNERN